MDRRFLALYDQELQHLRRMSGEFARAFPKIAGRLALDEFECADPYVERLIEGFAYLAARVQLKYDAEFPRLTQSILETVYPAYLSPTPSMAVAQFEPELAERGLATGMTVPRGEPLRTIAGREDRTPCEYRTAHDVTLWPVEVVEAGYHTRDLNTLNPPSVSNAQAGFRIRLQCGPGMTFSDLNLDALVFFIRGTGKVPVRIYEQVLAHAAKVSVQPARIPVPWRHVLPADHIRRVGYEPAQSLMPVDPRSFQGYRLLREYFALPERFLFFEINGLGEAVKRCEDSQLDLLLLVDRADLDIEPHVEKDTFVLHCTPAINLFPRRTDRVQVEDRFSEFHVVPDRTRPLDFEVYAIQEVDGYGSSQEQQQRFRSFYTSTDLDAGREGGGAYYMTRRELRLPTEREIREGKQSSYVDSDVFLSLVDASSAPYRGDLREMAVSALCTNRHLPLQVPVGVGPSDFTLTRARPVRGVKCVAGPTPPRPARVGGEGAWRAISHLSLNYLSLTDTASGEGVSALRDILRLYADTQDRQIRRQVEGVSAVSARPVSRRVGSGGPIAFARGVEIAVTLDEDAFEGTGEFLLGAVLAEFFRRHVTLNSFTETVVRGKSRGEIIRWPPTWGIRPNL